MTSAGPELRTGSMAGRLVIAATVLGSSVAALGATVVTIALPTSGETSTPTCPRCSG